MLQTHYTGATLKNRAANRAAVQEFFGLHDDNAPIFCIISRLTWQKGMDLIAACATRSSPWAAAGYPGFRDPALEGSLLAASAHPGRIGVSIGYNEPMSHLMQAGSDAIIPSRLRSPAA